MNESKHSTRFKGKTVFNSTTSRSMCWIKHLSLAILVTSLSGIKGQDVPSASVTPTFAPSVIDWTKPRQRKQMKDYFNRCNNLIENGDATVRQFCGNCCFFLEPFVSDKKKISPSHQYSRFFLQKDGK